MGIVEITLSYHEFAPFFGNILTIYNTVDCIFSDFRLHNSYRLQLWFCGLPVCSMYILYRSVYSSIRPILCVLNFFMTCTFSFWWKFCSVKFYYNDSQWLWVSANWSNLLCTSNVRCTAIDGLWRQHTALIYFLKKRKNL